MVNKSCTPPSDLKRASRTGPSAATKNGIELVPPATCPTVNCGFCPGTPLTKLLAVGKAFGLGEVPPVAGCEWQEPQESVLKAGPRPPLPGEVTATVSSWVNCDIPFWKNVVC